MFYQSRHVFFIILLFFSSANLNALSPFTIHSNLPQNIQAIIEQFIDENIETHALSIADLEQATTSSLKAFGYFAPECQYSKKLNPVSFSIQCNLGRPVIITQAVVSIIPPHNPELERAFSLMKFSLPQRFNTFSYQQYKQQLVRKAYELGFLDAEANSSEVIIHTDEYRASLYFKINTGLRHYFDEIMITPDIFNKDYLKSMAPFRKGSPFNSLLIKQYQQKLMETGLFKTVDVSYRDQPNYHSIPIDVSYLPNKPNSYHLMVGYNSDLNVDVLLETQRLFLSGRGLQWRNSIAWNAHGPVVESVIKYPRKHPQYDFYKASLVAKRLNLESYLSTKNYADSIALNLAYTTIQSKPLDSLAPDYRHYELIFSIDRDILNKVQQPWKFFIYPQYSMSSAHVIGRGLNLSVNSSLSASTHPLSPTSFVRAKLGLKTRWKLDKKNNFFMRNTLGWLNSASLETLPKSWQFKAGGMNSIRGFGYRSLILVPDQGAHNHYMVTQSIEYRYELFTSLSSELFVDAGMLGSNKTQKAATSVGIGIVWESPLGNIECSLAKPIVNHFNSQRKVKLGIALKHSF